MKGFMEEENQRTLKSSAQQSSGIVPTIIVEEKVTLMQKSNKNHEYIQPEAVTITRENLQGKSIDQDVITLERKSVEVIDNHPDETKPTETKETTSTCTRSSDPNMYVQKEPSYGDEKFIWKMIRKMSRTNKWTLENEKEELETYISSTASATERPTSLSAALSGSHGVLLAVKQTQKAANEESDDTRNPVTEGPGMRERQTVSGTAPYQTMTPTELRKPLAPTSTIRSPTPYHHYIPVLKQNFNKPLRKDDGNGYTMISSEATTHSRMSPTVHKSAKTRCGSISSALPADDGTVPVKPQQKVTDQEEETAFRSDSVNSQATAKDSAYYSQTEPSDSSKKTFVAHDTEKSNTGSDAPLYAVNEDLRANLKLLQSAPNGESGDSATAHSVASRQCVTGVNSKNSIKFPTGTSGNISECSPGDSFDKGLEAVESLTGGEVAADKRASQSEIAHSSLSTESSSAANKIIMPEVKHTSSELYSDSNLMGKVGIDERAASIAWDPTLLLNKLYEVSYEPRKESKLNRFTNMEGHLEVPVDDQSVYAELQKNSVQKYFRTRDGRLQWFASHFADDTPVGEVLLSSCEVDANKDENTLYIHGGRNHVKMMLRIPPGANVFDKWRKALNSHAASSYLDAFVNPVYPPLPHITEKVAIIELGSCSIRAGVLTIEPSLPQSFFPTVALVMDDGSFIVGSDALLPENRRNGELLRPLQATDSSSERYVFHRPALKACLQKCCCDLKIDPMKYRVLLSIPQNIPTVLIADLLKIILEELRFQGAAISRQPSLILYAYDVATGVVVDIGDCLNIVPVIDGYVVDSAIISLPYGAAQIVNALQVKLMESNAGSYTFQSPVERLILRYIMEQACFVATDYEEEVKKCKNNSGILDTVVSIEEFKPTSEMVPSFKINAARFTATEGLFKPKRWGLDTKALHQLVFEAVQSSPIDSRKTLFRNIYLAGGISLLPGLAERLEVELASLVAPIIHTQVHLSPWRYNAAYLGAQVIASSTQFDQTCITHESLNDFIENLQNSTF